MSKNPPKVDTLPPTIKAANEALNAKPVKPEPALPGFNAGRYANLKAPALVLADKIAAAEKLGVSVKHINMLLKVESLR
jgi:hypothetical protein